MSGHEDRCPHCRAKTGLADAETTSPVVHAPVEFPATPRLFRVHHHGRPPQDCTLHPDGRMTMQAAGQSLTSMLSFDVMREMNWRTAHIEWDPPPLPEEPPAVEAGVDAMQAAIPIP